MLNPVYIVKASSVWLIVQLIYRSQNSVRSTDMGRVMGFRRVWAVRVPFCGLP